VLHRRHVDFRIVGFYALGAFAAAAVAGLITVEPTRASLYLFMGLIPFLVWIPDGVLKLDAQQPLQALVCGAGVTGVNLTAGVAGPVLDIFFVKTSLTRHQIVATKAATQVFSHLMKIVVYGAPLIAVGGKGLPPAWVFVLAVPLSIAGTTAGGVLLNRLSDVNFKRYLRLILSVIGLAYLAQAARLFWLGA
jgi:uncharacterized membrane protein YfcA